VVSGFDEYAWRTDQIDRDLNERLRGQVPGGYRPYKAFLHHLGTTPIQRNVLKQPRERRRGQQTLTTTQIEQVVETCKTPRDRRIVHMLFETGLRPGELLALWLEDVKISPTQVRVVDRGEPVNDAEIKRPASERAIDISRDLVNRVLDYASVAHSEAVETNHLLLKQHGKPSGCPDGLRRSARAVRATAATHRNGLQQSWRFRSGNRHVGDPQIGDATVA
jgi:integrase